MKAKSLQKSKKSYKESRKKSNAKPTQNAAKPTNRPFNKRKKKGEKNGAWNQVPIGEEFYGDKEFENLVSFEEMTDYDVVVKEDGTKEILSGEPVVKEPQAGKKRKLDKTGEENGSSEKPKKKEERKKSKKEVKKAKKEKEQDAADLDGDVINTSAGIVIVEDEDPVVDVVDVGGEGNDDDDDLVEEEKGEEEEEEEEEIENDAFESSEWTKLGVPDLIMKSLKEKGFNKPTTIQALTLPAAILGKKDVVGAAETGSGKTLAFAIPIIHGILQDRKKKQDSSLDDDKEEGSSLSALILTPTRELAVQIKNHFDVAAKYTDIKTVVIVGGLATQKQERLLRMKPDVVIATPGRLWELVHEGDPHLSTLNRVKFLAIDETDRMVERGHFQELENILNVINRDESCKEKRQNFVFSATLSFTHEPPQRLKKFVKKNVKQQPKKLTSKEKLKQIMDMVGLRPNPKIVDITTSKGTCETLTEMQIMCSHDHKDYYLYYFLTTNPGRTIVFSNSINCVRRLTNLFFLLEIGEVLPLHSEMHQKMRLRNLERFSANDKAVLIATDVAARGLDIQNIEHVIHYQVPKTAESYIHRSGRTARAFKGGLAVLMIEPGETTTVKNIFRSLGREEMLPPFDVDGKVFRDLKSTIEMAVKVEQFEHRVRKQLADQNWMDKAKKDMDLASSSDESDEEGGSVTQKKSLQKARKQLESYKKQLSQMVSKNSTITLGISSKIK